MRPLEDLLSAGLIWTAVPNAAGDALLKKLAMLPVEIQPKRDPSWGVSFGAAEIDSAFTGAPLRSGEIHEWGAPPQDGLKDKDLLLPHSLFTLLMKQALSGQSRKRRTHIFWIGRCVWPTPHLLQEVLGREALQHCFFLDPPDDNQRLWATVEALRSNATLIVVSQLPRLRMALSKKLALAAAAGGGVGFIVRPVRELLTLSAASSRWEVSPTPSATGQPTWDIRLKSYKGQQPVVRSWRIEFVHEVLYAKVSLRVSPTLVSEYSTTTAHEAKVLRA